MTRKIGYGLVRNGEHISLHDSHSHAKKAQSAEKESDEKAQRKGWGIGKAHYHIMRVTSRTW